jgi:hypothetical protein
VVTHAVVGLISSLDLIRMVLILKSVSHMRPEKERRNCSLPMDEIQNRRFEPNFASRN